eukprot:GHVU01022813.1.p1 GENE.GHVU01022813.1~~GHVU01022813.1.p1  ORF type:complete len:189 (-),score=28.26 GHVU01022813.1:110-676(-)
MQSAADVAGRRALDPPSRTVFVPGVLGTQLPRISTTYVGSHKTYMCPACIHGFCFCINPNFLKCWVTDAGMEVVPNKVCLRNDMMKDCGDAIDKFKRLQGLPTKQYVPGAIAAPEWSSSPRKNGGEVQKTDRRKTTKASPVREAVPMPIASTGSNDKGWQKVVKKEQDGEWKLATKKRSKKKSYLAKE